MTEGRQKDHPGQYRQSDSLWLQGHPITISGHMKEKKTGNCQHVFTMGKSSLTSLLAFFNKVTGFADKEKSSKCYLG